MSSWSLSPSIHSLNTVNPVRESATSISLPSNFHKPTYSLAIGDPSKFSDFEAFPFVVDTVAEKLKANKGNGYTDAQGLYEARESLAQYYSYDNLRLRPEDVIIDIGGVGAIHSVLQIFLNPGDNILIPSPGFPLYQTIARNLNAEALVYNLKPDQHWEVDFDSLDAQVSSKTKLLVVVNPSNPCGSVFSKEHQLEILSWADRHHIPILSDEVYHKMTFGKPYYPFGSLTDSVPVFTIGALSKMFLVPGWRCGWIVIYDKYNHCHEFRSALTKIKNMLLHPAPFIMQAIPEILANCPQNYFEELMEKVKVRADVVKKRIEAIDGLFLSESEGSLYTIVSVDLNKVVFRDTVEFAQEFAKEEGVVVLPAEAFLSHSGFRVVLCNPVGVLEECLERLAVFVERHRVRDG